MAENSVVKDQLTDAMVDAGAALTQKLDEVGLPLSAAYWFFMPDISEWRLLIASSEVSTKGPRAVYDTISAAIEQLGEKASASPLSAVSVLDAEADLVKLLRTAVHTDPKAVSRIRFSRNTVNGHYIDDVLIYRAA